MSPGRCERRYAILRRSPCHVSLPRWGRSRRQLSPLLILCAVSQAIFASSLDVHVEAPDGRAAAGIVVMARHVGQVQPAHPVNAVMDQIDLAFKPDVLVIPVGSSVSFPNSDSVSHQVYSFSPAKKFQLALYRGKPYSPMRFDQAGVVTLGCNIHDYMLGFIVVTDAAYFGVTDANGNFAVATMEAGDYDISLWHARARETDASLKRQIHVESAASSALTFQLGQKPAPAPLKTPERKWDY
jgi:plastocyanin